MDALKHSDDKRRNIPTAEYQSLLADEARKPVQVSNPRSTSNAPHLMVEREVCDPDLDPQKVWRAKDAHNRPWTNRMILRDSLPVSRSIGHWYGNSP